VSQSVTILFDRADMIVSELVTKSGNSDYWTQKERPLPSTNKFDAREALCRQTNTLP